jgi:hypothetical protein
MQCSVATCAVPTPTYVPRAHACSWNTPYAYKHMYSVDEQEQQSAQGMGEQWAAEPLCCALVEKLRTGKLVETREYLRVREESLCIVYAHSCALRSPSSNGAKEQVRADTRMLNA